MIISFAIFFFILVTYTAKKVKQLTCLKEEIDALTNVTLNSPITKKNNDEIGDIARGGVDFLRQSVIEKMKKERIAYKNNQSLITTLSHDLRTPLTSIIGYMEILEKKDNTIEEEKNIELLH